MSVFKNIRIRVDKVLCPVHKYPFLFEKGGFLSLVSPTIRTYPVKKNHRKLIFSKTLSRVKIFENASFSFTLKDENGSFRVR